MLWESPTTCTVCMVCNTFQTILLLSKVTFWLVMHTFPLILRSVILKHYPNLPISDQVLEQQNNFVTTWQYMLALVNRYIMIAVFMFPVFFSTCSVGCEVRYPFTDTLLSTWQAKNDDIPFFFHSSHSNITCRIQVLFWQ